MNREQAEKLLAALIFDDLDEASKAELQAYLMTDDELRERLADMRMTARLTGDAVNDGPDPVLSEQRLEKLRQLARTKTIKLRIVTARFLIAAAAVLVLGLITAALFMPSLSRVRHYSARVADAKVSAENARLRALQMSGGASIETQRPFVTGSRVADSNSPSPPSSAPAGSDADHYASISRTDQGQVTGVSGAGGMGGNDLAAGYRDTRGYGGSMGGLAGGGMPRGGGAAYTPVYNHSGFGARGGTLNEPTRQPVATSSSSSTRSQETASKTEAAKSNGREESRDRTVVRGLPVSPVTDQELKSAAPYTGAVPYGWKGTLSGKKPSTDEWDKDLNGPTDRIKADLPAETAAPPANTKPPASAQDSLLSADEAREPSRRAGRGASGPPMGETTVVRAGAPTLPTPGNAAATPLGDKPLVGGLFKNRYGVNFDQAGSADLKMGTTGSSQAGAPRAGPGQISGEILNWGSARQAQNAFEGDTAVVRGQSHDKANDVKLDMNFQDAPVDSVLKYLSDKASLTVVASGVPLDGRVTVNSDQPVSVDQAVSLINSVLKEKDLAAVRTGKTVKIMSVSQAKQQNIPITTGTDFSALPDTDEFVTHIISIRYVDAQGLAQNLTPLLPQNASMEANRDGNALIITDTTSNIRRLMKIIQALDMPMSTGADIKVWRPTNAHASSTAQLINNIFQKEAQAVRGTTTTGAGTRDDLAVVATADDRTNSIVVRGSPEVLNIINGMIEQLDKRGTEIADVRTKQLQNADASKVAQLVNKMFEQAAPPNSPDAARGVNVNMGVKAAADAKTNTVVVSGPAGALAIADGIISQLDKESPQVAQNTASDIRPATLGTRIAEEDAGALPAESRFKVVPVNPWVMTERDALSTFALTVDKASYALCRRYIRSGFLPPIGAVRMEEFVNAFDYAYPQRNDATFAVYADGAPSPFAPAGQDLTLLKIAVKARTVGRDQRRAAHLVFVVDASASMGQPDRLPLVQSALDLLIGKLSETDRVSLITCANDARLHLEAVPARQKDAIRQTIDAIQPAGPTNLLAGIKLGYATARKAFVAGQINQVVLCSDGMANVGQTDAEAVLQEVAQDRKQGITITCVGVGYGAYNDAFLESMADHGDGQYVFLDPSTQAQEDLVGQLASTMQTVAQDARIQVQFNPNRVRRYRLVGYENRDIEDQRFRDDTIEAGAVGSGQCSTALYELELLPPSAGEAGADIGTVFVRYRNTDTGQIEEISRPLAGSMIRRRSVEADPRFFLAAGAARLAEWLRQSEHAKDTSLADVQRVLDQVSAALPLDRDIQDLAALAHQAQSLPRAP